MRIRAPKIQSICIRRLFEQSYCPRSINISFCVTKLDKTFRAPTDVRYFQILKLILFFPCFDWYGATAKLSFYHLTTVEAHERKDRKWQYLVVVKLFPHYGFLFGQSWQAGANHPDSWLWGKVSAIYRRLYCTKIFCFGNGEKLKRGRAIVKRGLVSGSERR